MTVAQSISRLQSGYYNSNPVSPTNPGGLASDGHTTNFPAALVDLGIVGALMQGVNGDSVVAALQSAGGRSGIRNRVVNGGFDIWQRGTSFNAAGFTADRWSYSISGGGAAVVSRNTDVPSTEFAYSADVTVTTGTAQLAQRLEEFATLRNRPWSISGWVKGPVGGSCGLTVYDGAFAGPNVNTTGAWQYITGSGTLNAAAAICQVAFGINTTGVYRAAGLQFEVGQIATPFDRRPFAVELDLARRFFFSTFPDGTAPAASAGYSGAPLLIQRAVAGAVRHRGLLRLPTRMRGAPTLTLFNPSAAGAQAYAYDQATSCTLTQPASWLASIDQVAIESTLPAGGTVGDTAAVHFTADAEI